MKLFSSFKEVITEAVSFDDLQKAIKNLDVITITYDGDEPVVKVIERFTLFV